MVGPLSINKKMKGAGQTGKLRDQNAQVFLLTRRTTRTEINDVLAVGFIRQV
jgi:hypothetical protein